jgi:hypothetical protein
VTAPWWAYPRVYAAPAYPAVYPAAYAPYPGYYPAYPAYPPAYPAYPAYPPAVPYPPPPPNADPGPSGPPPSGPPGSLAPTPEPSFFGPQAPASPSAGGAPLPATLASPPAAGCENVTVAGHWEMRAYPDGQRVTLWVPTSVRSVCR